MFSCHNWILIIALTTGQVFERVNKDIEIIGIKIDGLA